MLVWVRELWPLFRYDWPSSPRTVGLERPEAGYDKGLAHFDQAMVVADF